MPTEEEFSKIEHKVQEMGELRKQCELLRMKKDNFKTLKAEYDNLSGLISQALDKKLVRGC